MKKLTILLISILISFNSYGKWTEVVESEGGDTMYIDTSTIKERNGYVYYWELTNWLKPSKYGDMSYKAYVEVDCAMVRSKYLSAAFYTQHMTLGTFTSSPLTNEEWRYLSPGSVGAEKINYACNYVK
jgi:hypothetical protein